MSAKRNNKKEQKPNPMPEQFDKKGWMFVQVQNGSIKKWGKNGVTDDDFIKVALKRLEGKNNLKPSKANAMVITKLQEALMWYGLIEEV